VCHGIRMAGRAGRAPGAPEQTGELRELRGDGTGAATHLLGAARSVRIKMLTLIMMNTDMQMNTHMQMNTDMLTLITMNTWLAGIDFMN